MSSPPRSSIKKRKTPTTSVQFVNHPIYLTNNTPEKSNKLRRANNAAAAAINELRESTPERKRTMIETRQIIDRQYKLTMREIDETIKIAVQIISNNSAPTVKILTQLDTAKENITVPLAKFKALHPPSKYITLIDTEMAKMNSLLAHAKKPKTTPFVFNQKPFIVGKNPTTNPKKRPTRQHSMHGHSNRLTGAGRRYTYKKRNIRGK